MPKFFTQYNPLEDKGFACVGESKTIQEFKDDCDIKVLIKRMESGMSLSPDSVKRGLARAPEYGDFSRFQAMDFAEMQNQINEARDNFMALPSDLRSRFGDDPARFIEWVNDSTNMQEAIKLGLVVPRKNDVVQKVDSSSVVSNEIQDNKEVK